MFPGLSQRPWQVFCRVYLHHRSNLSQRPPWVARPCYGESCTLKAQFWLVVFEILFLVLATSCVKNVIWRIQHDHNPDAFVGWQNGGIHSLWLSLPDYRVASLTLGHVQYYSTSGSSKDEPPSPPGPDSPPTAEKVLAGATQPSSDTTGNRQVPACVHLDWTQDCKKFIWREALLVMLLFSRVPPYQWPILIYQIAFSRSGKWAISMTVSWRLCSVMISYDFGLSKKTVRLMVNLINSQGHLSGWLKQRPFKWKVTLNHTCTSYLLALCCIEGLYSCFSIWL